MRSTCALVGLALIVAACATDDEDTGDAPTAATTVEDEMSDDTPSDDPSADEETTPPESDAAGVSEPEDTLVLVPRSSAKVILSTTAGEPIGGDESLFEGQFEPGLDPFVELATADLAVRLDAAEDDIVAISATLVTWPDSSIGCPLPGIEYLQVLQDGSLIELGHDSKVYRYHTGGERITPFLCDQPFAQPPVSSG